MVATQENVHGHGRRLQQRLGRGEGEGLCAKKLLTVVGRVIPPPALAHVRRHRSFRGGAGVIEVGAEETASAAVSGEKELPRQKKQGTPPLNQREQLRAKTSDSRGFPAKLAQT